MTEILIDARSLRSAMHLGHVLARFGGTEVIPIDRDTCRVALTLEDESGGVVAEVFTTVREWLRIQGLTAAKVRVERRPQSARPPVALLRTLATGQRAEADRPPGSHDLTP